MSKARVQVSLWLHSVASLRPQYAAFLVTFYHQLVGRGFESPSVSKADNSDGRVASKHAGSNPAPTVGMRYGLRDEL